MRPPCIFTTAVVLTALIACGVACGSGGGATDRLQDNLGPRLEAGSTRTFLDMIEYEAAAADDIALCMLEQGFEYKPFLYTRELERFPRLVADTAADPEAFAQTYGYGLTDPEWASSPQHDPSTFTAPDPDYDRALYGDVDLQNGRPEGCWGNRIAPVVEAIETFEVERADLNTRIDQNPDIEAARQAWERCMAELGYSYRSPAAAFEYFRSEFNRIRFTARPGDPSNSQPLEELLTEEIRTATADQIECDGIELRSLRLAVAQDLGLSEDAAAALSVLAADDTSLEE